MVSLDNFHTDNGVQLRRTQYPDQERRMRAIGLGLVSHRDWNLADQVPTSLAMHRASDYVSNHHVAPKYTERRDVHTLDLYVPTRPYVDRLRGATADTLLLYDQVATSHPGNRCCPLRSWLGGWSHRRHHLALNANSTRVRHRPY